MKYRLPVDCFNVEILDFFKLHVNFINSRRHVMNFVVCFLDVCYLFSQVQQDRRQTLTEFIKEGEANLRHGEQCSLTDIAVTSDNKLLLCNYQSSHPKVY
jgi:hypothetical protein